jgi:kinesin family protein 4/21/27
MRSYDENSITSSESMTDLKREVARFKDTESHSAKYIAELEARLARQDESVITLQQTTERLEKECERRRNEVELLQTRLKVLQEDGESWKADLDQREKRVRELEAKMEEWEKKKQDVGEARERLGNVVGEVVQARRSLQVDIPQDRATSSEPNSASTDHSVHRQLFALQETHTATLADLSAMTAKYRDALREISDLAAQIQEAKLGNTQTSEVTEEPLSPRRRLNQSRSRDAADPHGGRRLFFRHAASAESLHLR